MKQFDDLGAVIKAALAAAALVPGVVLIPGLVDLPPDNALLGKIGGSLLAPMMVMAAILLRPWIARLRVPVALMVAFGLLAGGIFLMAEYDGMDDARVHTVTFENRDCAGTLELVVVEPSEFSPALTELTAGHGGFLGALADPDICPDVLAQGRTDSRPEQDRMLWLLLATEALLLAAFLMLALRTSAFLKQGNTPHAERP